MTNKQTNNQQQLIKIPRISKNKHSHLSILWSLFQMEYKYLCPIVHLMIYYSGSKFAGYHKNIFKNNLYTLC